MSRRTIKLLHVEDDPLQQRVLAHHLKLLAEFAFEITSVDGEERALEAFRGGKFDLVVLDYQLAQGDGLHLLQRLRQDDPIVPIFAISGVATSEVAAALVGAGADDYFDKRDLLSSELAKRVRTALLRTDTVRKRLPDLALAPSRLESMLLEVSNRFIQSQGRNCSIASTQWKKRRGKATSTARSWENSSTGSVLGSKLPADLENESGTSVRGVHRNR
jgi:DNA-binding response OmpR family regulator